MENIIFCDSDLLQKQISENSKKLDEALKELREVANRLSEGLKKKAAA